jgi:hypothetical protein
MHQLLPQHVAHSRPHTQARDRSLWFEKCAPIPWTDEMQQAFDKMHALMAADALTAYPDHNKWFDIYTTASDFQLGVCIMQEDRPVAYFSSKTLKSKQHDTVIRKKCSRLLLPLKNFEVCSLVQIFRFY